MASVKVFSFALLLVLLFSVVHPCVAIPTQNLGGASQTLTQGDATAGVLKDVTTKKVVSANVLAEDNAIVIVKNHKTM
ncbi:hypothetical protein F2Q69_00018562 [Brassica cretica]|uniref:Uncharacterized protein n=1 Tax=Brassica cretica TaxID=69181 RepID=A0A8S9QFQ9_BRACR|nr:hypothetical protein F2Q69_00018562 [Brassica cretica]